MAELETFTKLYKEAFLKADLEKELKRAARFGRPLSLLAVEALMPEASLKEMEYSVIVQLARLVREIVRDIDYPVRWGRRILLVLPETSREGAVKVADKIRNAAQGRRYVGGENYSREAVELRFGFAVFPEDGLDNNALLDMAAKDLEISWEQKTLTSKPLEEVTIEKAAEAEAAAPDPES